MIKGASRFEYRTLMLLAAILMAGFLKTAIAQDVVGVSEILSSTSSTEIDTYSATDLSYDVSLYYGAYVEGYLYDNNNLIGEGSAQAQQDAYGYMTKPLTVGDIYTIESDHYLIASFAYSEGGYNYYDNPDYFYPGDEGGPMDPSGSSFTEGGGPEYVETQYIYLGTTGVQLSSAQPSINSISPNMGSTGTSGTIAVNGDNLLDPFTGNASPSITGSGITLTPENSSTNTQVDLNYSIDQTAATGDRSLTLQDRFGTSNAVTFTVAYPPAVVTNISPFTWTAGQTTSVTITGTGFGTAPTLSVTGSGVALTLNSASPDGTTIQATATVNATAPSQSVTVQVTPGYTGNSFTCNCQGQSPNGTDTATIQPIAPPPQIIFNSQNISGTTQTVWAGQKIVLSVATASGYTIQSQSWSFSNQSAITGGFVDGNGDPGTQPSASAGGSEAADPPLNQNSLTFYWVNPGENGETVTCNYTLTNGASASATATFNIQGPTGTLLPNAFAQSDITGTSLSNAQASPAELSMTNSPTKPGVGVLFNDNAQPVSDSGQCPPSPGASPAAGCGQFIWVQILTSVTQLQIVESGDTFTPSNASNQLDGTYPYAFGGPPNATWDSPKRGLLGAWGEGAEPFHATMYVLWDPALPAGCTPAWTDTTTRPYYTPHASTCTSIPIPLGSVQWGWSACAINGLAPAAGGGTTPSWFLQCGTGSGNTAGAASGYPEWTSGTGPGGCEVSDFANCQ